MHELARLTAIEEIRRIKGAYFRAVDLKDAVLLASTFAREATADYRGAVVDPSGHSHLPDTDNKMLIGVDKIVPSVMAAVALLVTVHHPSSPEIEITGEDSATGIWPIVDRLRLPPGGDVAEIIGYGYYHETYVREDGRWKIATLRMSRLRVDFIAA